MSKLLTSTLGRTRARRVLPFTTLAIATSLLLTACGGGSTPETAVPAGEADTTATVTFSFGTDGGKNYDPHVGGNQFLPVFLLPVYDRLFDLDPEGKPIPMLAEESSWSDDNLELTLKLRQGVKFHDGTDFNAAAVKANLDRGMGLDISVVKGDLVNVASVDVVDDSTIKISMKAPDAALTTLLADKAGMIISPDALDNADLDLMPVGAGPFKVVADDPGVKVTYERFDDYWGDNSRQPQTLELIIQIDTEARLRAMNNGDQDASSLNMNQVDLITNPNLITVDPAKVNTQAYLVYLNMGHNPAMADPKVREALSLSLDRNGINKGVLSGQCEVNPQLFPAGYWAASTKLPADAADQNIEKAKKLLAEAGYESGLTLAVSAIKAQQYAAVAEAVAAQFEAIGVTVDLRIGDPVQVVGGFTGEKNVDTYVSIWPGAADPSKTVSSLYLPTGQFNPGGYDVPEITALAEDGRAELDPDKRAAIYQQISQLAFENHMQLPICTPNNPLVTKNDITGIVSMPNGHISLNHVEKLK